MQLKLYVISLIRYFGFTSLIGLDPLDQAPLLKEDNTTLEETNLAPPIFEPPGTGKDNSIKCNYTGLPGWWHPDSPDLRGVWLRNNKTGREYNITTDYETSWPQGVRRDYHIVVNNDTTANWDGIPFPGAKMFNGTFPGPWIQACWGDSVHVTITNNLTYNGTAIHMHGLRMLNNSLMDGVPGVTQCPIAPGESFTYKFRATQYGTTWYHSHYSLQYSDGIYGPLTIHGPTSANWDESIDPILLGDHNHRSAFQDYYQEQFSGHNRPPPKMTSILINGRAVSHSSGCTKHCPKDIPQGKRYLMRLINTSTDTTYVFAIDNHNFTVVQSDLVPVNPYVTDHLAIGIGQRYHVVLNTWPDEQRNGTDEFWMRTVPADHCNNFGEQLDVRQGILYYQGHKNEWPTTTEGKYNYTCRDEPHERLRPVVPWNVPRLNKDEKLELGVPNSTIMLAKWFLPAEPHRPNLTGPEVNNWQMMRHPLWVDYSKPTVNNTDGPFGDNDAVYPVEKSPLHQQGNGNWSYMVIIGNQTNFGPPKGGKLVPAAHPLHFHGHDFALLKQSEYPYNGTDSLGNLTYDNPPRRDVVLLPKNGFVVIAFKTDNPGAWAVHCHIAWHASAGLAFQILESKEEFKEYQWDTQHWQKEQFNRTCQRWKQWYSNPKHFYEPNGRFQDDSGV
ncbi:multicopper oxidase [Aspergillus fischeri NRRL 181]|uniref:Multicopper oxidase n=1 Tax=Neosartorya fischeri (strain ATCC 1020 / DSM 3700 / CBS 544.65 / FGSC A1164 / JCM 1740 / NRRL 181 / WB 181) TaxID=331117 RepID=A1DD39_NEOFI|nr:multicopper oxidase [Aspergillus fischeri NRRL 181]EAW17296.1 multicopper oxidase [Aspergillus fischeri NRRL 181]